MSPSAAIAPDPDFGRVLFHQKPKAGQVGNVVFLIVLGAPMMLVVFARAAPIGVKLGLFIFGAAIVGFALLMLWRQWMHVFLQERGIREYRQRRGRSLAFDQVDELIYSAGRIFAHGSYVHTIEKLALKSEQMPGPPLVCTHIFKDQRPKSPGETPTPIIDVRNAVSWRLAERMSRRLAREGAVAWTPELRIRAEGLEIIEKGGRWQMVKWQRLDNIGIDQGKLVLAVAGGVQLRMDRTKLSNFYPAYFLAMRLREEAKNSHL